MPDYLEPADPASRRFPDGWFDAAILLLSDEQGWVSCQSENCKERFKGRAQLRSLHADHIKPYSRGGRTTWENLQILCGPCNLEKNDSI